MAALFQVNCPKCGAPLLPENVNVAGDVFLGPYILDFGSSTCY